MTANTRTWLNSGIIGYELDSDVNYTGVNSSESTISSSRRGGSDFQALSNTTLSLHSSQGISSRTVSNALLKSDVYK